MYMIYFLFFLKFCLGSYQNRPAINENKPANLLTDSLSMREKNVDYILKNYNNYDTVPISKDLFLYTSIDTTILPNRFDPCYFYFAVFENKNGKERKVFASTISACGDSFDLKFDTLYAQMAIYNAYSASTGSSWIYIYNIKNKCTYKSSLYNLNNDGSYFEIADIKTINFKKMQVRINRKRINDSGEYIKPDMDTSYAIKLTYWR